jgi:hypothetical protein
LASTQSSHPSESYSKNDVERLAGKLKEFRNNVLENDQQRELLDHLIAGAESLFKQETKEEVIVLDKQIEEATISALRPFIDSKRGKPQCYFWIRRG